MSLPSKYAGYMFKLGLCVTGWISYATFQATPASAQDTNVPAIPTITVEQGGFSGVITYITPSSYVSSIAAEKVSPEGTYLAGIDGNGTYIVTGSAYIHPVTHVSTPIIVLFGGRTIPLPVATSDSVAGAVANTLTYGNLTLDEYTAIIRSITPGLF